MNTRADTPADPVRILGVSLLRNEDRCVAWSLANAVRFCDRLMVLDNGSSDRTREIVERLAARSPNVEVIDVEDAYDTHRFVEPFAGTRAWVLGIDGDEIFDPAGLSRLRARIVAGEFDRVWRISGHTLHLTGGDLAAARGEGFTGPPARTITKLYNFAAIDSWREGRHQRLHGRNMRFRPGFSMGAKWKFHQHMTWEESDFRCLHLCFLPRSSAAAGEFARRNPSEAQSAARASSSLAARFRRLVGLPSPQAAYKRRHYAKGSVTAASLAGFGRPTDHLDLDPRADEAEAALQAALRGPAAAAAGVAA